MDAYQEWCGPCKAMVSNFKRLKNEIGDDLLHFAIVSAHLFILCDIVIVIDCFKILIL